MPTANVNGLRIDYIDTGTGTPVIFVPGIAGSKEWFAYQTSGLSDRYRIISYDLRKKRLFGEYTLNLLVEDLRRFLGKLRIGSAVIVGYSFGGLIALQFAESYPDLCLALVLVSAAPNFPNLPDDELLKHLLPESIKVDNFLNRIWNRFFGAGQVREAEAGTLDYLAKNIGSLDRATLSARLRIMKNTDLAPKLAGIVEPTLIITGSNDFPCVLAGSQTLYETIDGSILEVIEDADGFCFYTRYDLFNSILADFLAHRVAPA